MSDINHIYTDVQKALSEEGKKFSDRVKTNLRTKGISKSGKTEQSIHQDATPSSLIVWGREDFDNLEKGISPQQSKSKNFDFLKRNLYEWSKFLPLNFDNNKKRYSFARNVAKKQNEQGSLLFRKGGRSDIYTSEYQPLYDELSKRIGNIILEHKLL